MAYPIHISSDTGLQWGNHVIPAKLLAEIVGDGVVYENGLLTFDGVKIVNRDGSEHVSNAKGEKIYLRDMVLQAMDRNNEGQLYV